jgi:fructokinase
VKKQQPIIMTFGEALIDFISQEKPQLSSGSLFKCYPGGAPANVAVGLARLKVPVRFVGKVGSDSFGDMLFEKLKSEGVDINGIIESKDSSQKTALAFVLLDQQCDRHFHFYRQNCADQNIQPEELQKVWFKNVKYFLFGSLSLVNEPSRSTTYKAINYAKNNGALICFDPNLRLSLWESKMNLKKELRKVIKETDILLPSSDELSLIKEFFLTKEMDEVSISNFMEKF